ncbi:MAG TPA: bifunctional hydroxymethylpyrimidine kinase/phosphomethylpyrimidine kinase [Chloroflexota bacterium]|nr:bifunctional hydroxymethylpyrimidine kinase/phosphomethylpyrimidine kinase [Chloroflexota bacterium]
MDRVPTVLTIAGSDSGGGAGIQADLKTFSALGVFGMSALTAITAQNTRAVTAVFELPPDIVAAQIDAVVEDIGVDAAKTGMIANSELIRVVADKVRQHRLEPLVVDPVMVAKSGDRLLREEAVEALRAELVPLATVVTPNLPEAEVLVGRSLGSLDDMRAAAREIVGLGARSVVVKGGHLAGDATDVFYDGQRLVELSAPRVQTSSTHGTGCTLASAIAALLARGDDLEAAVRGAKSYLTAALERAYPIGGGHGPVHHFHEWWAR